MKQKTQSKASTFNVGDTVLDPSDIEGVVIDSPYAPELIRVAFDGRGGNWRDLDPSKLRHAETQSEVTVNESKHTKGEWYWYDSKKDRWGGYSAGEWVQFELATKLSGKPLDTQSIGKISFTAKGGNNKDDYEVCKANAQRIVTAVNMHDELVGLLKFIRESYWDLMTEEIVNHIDTAIAKATNSK